jgi:plastocyanin
MAAPCRLPGIVLLTAALLPVSALAQRTVEVSIADYRFAPAEVRIRPGDTVKWINREKRTSHSVLFAGQPESERLFPDEAWQRTFAKPGTYPYTCGPHPEMKGVVYVAD